MQFEEHFILYTAQGRANFVNINNIQEASYDPRAQVLELYLWPQNRDKELTTIYIEGEEARSIYRAIMLRCINPPN